MERYRVSGILNIMNMTRSSVITSNILVGNLRLIKELVWRDIVEPHVGQVLGKFWVLMNPLILVLTYIFIFNYVFKIKMISNTRMPSYDYTVYMLSGLSPWLVVQQCLSKLCSAITNNVHLVKQVIFPIEILPVKAVLVTLYTQCMLLLILIFYELIKFNGLPSMVFLLPFVILFQIIFLIGLGYLLASLSVFIKDLKELVALFSLVGTFLLPITYLPDWVPSMLKPLLFLNPFSYLIWCYQDIFYYRYFKHIIAWYILLILAVFMYSLGCYVFNGTKHLFSDFI